MKKFSVKVTCGVILMRNGRKIFRILLFLENDRKMIFQKIYLPDRSTDRDSTLVLVKIHYYQNVNISTQHIENGVKYLHMIP